MDGGDRNAGGKEQAEGHKRAGPRPLPVHILTAVQQALLENESGAKTTQQIQDMVQGMKDYVNHPYRRLRPPREKIWQKGQVSLYRTDTSDNIEDEQNGIILIPSLINRSIILDLLPERSLVNFLTDHGYTVFLLDWGNPLEDKEGLSSLDNVLNRLSQAVLVASDHGEESLSGFGYCMGGTLLMQGLLREACREAFSKLEKVIFMASPWDFDAEPANLARHIRMGASAATQIIDERGYLPVRWIQTVFATVTARKNMEKYIRFSTLSPESDKAQLFTAVEDWLNDGVDLPGGIARTCIQDWYGRNKPAVATVGDTLDIPSLIIASKSDALVPYNSSMALSSYFDSVEILEPEIGHIGMITGSRAVSDVWEPMVSWLLRI